MKRSLVGLLWLLVCCFFLLLLTLYWTEFQTSENFQQCKQFLYTPHLCFLNANILSHFTHLLSLCLFLPLIIVFIELVGSESQTWCYFTSHSSVYLLKNKDTLLPDYNTMIRIRKLMWMQYYCLTIDLIQISTIVLIMSSTAKENHNSCVALSCQVSQSPLIWNSSSVFLHTS